MVALDGPEGREGAVCAAYRAELEVLGAVGSARGQSVLALAAALDDRAGVVNLSATAKVLDELMEKVRAAAPARGESDLDRLRKRRAARSGDSAAAGS